MNLYEEIDRIKLSGYSEQNAQSRPMIEPLSSLRISVNVAFTSVANFAI